MQDFEEVASASAAVFEVTEMIADECPTADSIGPQQLNSLTAALTAAYDKMSELVQQAQQQENDADAAGSDDNEDEEEEAGE